LGDGKLIMGLKTIVNQLIFGVGIRRNSSLFETLVSPIILYGCEVWGCGISRESSRKVETIQNKFITYNLKIKANAPYPILLLETNLAPIENMVVTRYLMYKNKLKNIEDTRIRKIASESSHKHHRLK
jgi:hypothetical protein